MAEERIKKAMNFLKNLLDERNIKIEKIIVFGSRAKGGFKEDSDIDVALVSREFEGKDIFERSEMLKGLKWELIGKFMLPIDIVSISLKEWEESSSLIVEYIKEGKTLSF